MSGKIIATSSEVTSDVGIVRESFQNPRNIQVWELLKFAQILLMSSHNFSEFGMFREISFELVGFCCIESLRRNRMLTLKPPLFQDIQGR